MQENSNAQIFRTVCGNFIVVVTIKDKKYTERFTTLADAKKYIREEVE